MATQRDNYYEFPIVKKESKTGKFTVCTIYCGMIRQDADANVFDKLTDPEEISNIAARLKKEYNDNSIITDPVKGFIVKRTGYENGKITFRKATFVVQGIHYGDANQLNTWTYTLEKAKSQYTKLNKVNENPDLVRPMLASGEAVSNRLLNGHLKLIYNQHKGNYLVQLKYDGHRMVCRLSDINCYSRTAEKTYISDELYDELTVIQKNIKSVIPEYKNISLDGEYYVHGQSLQSISSAVRVEKQSPEKSELIYHVFDLMLLNSKNEILEVECIDRIKLLGRLRSHFESYGFHRIVFVKSWLNPNFKSLKDHYQNALKNGYEGLVLKLCNAIYEPGHNNYHSKVIIKIKELLREEFLIVGYKTGKGKAEGTIILECKLTEETVDKAIQYIRSHDGILSIGPYAALNNKFNVRPKLTEEESKKLYQDVISETIDIIGKLYTVEFRDWSDKLMPLQPVGIAFFN